MLLNGGKICSTNWCFVTWLIVFLFFFFCGYCEETECIWSTELSTYYMLKHSFKPMPFSHNKWNYLQNRNYHSFCYFNIQIMCKGLTKINNVMSFTEKLVKSICFTALLFWWITFWKRWLNFLCYTSNGMFGTLWLVLALAALSPTHQTKAMELILFISSVSRHSFKKAL